MTHYTLSFEDDISREIAEYTSEANISFEKMTKKYWLDLLAKRRAEKSNDAEFLALLENTKGIWQQGDGLTYQENLRAEWDR